MLNSMNYMILFVKAMTKVLTVLVFFGCIYFSLDVSEANGAANSNLDTDLDTQKNGILIDHESERNSLCQENCYAELTYQRTAEAIETGIDINPGSIDWTYDRADLAAIIVEGNSGGSQDRFNIQRFQSITTPMITSDPITTGTVGQVYSYVVEADGSPVPTYTLTTAPAGMSVDENSGLISWGPTMTGIYSVAVTAVNTAGMDLQSFTIDVMTGSVDIISTPTLTQVAIGHHFVYDVEVTGAFSPTYSLTNAPAGMTIDANTGLVFWTPEITGTFPITVEVSGAAGTDSQSFAFDVQDFELSCATPVRLMPLGDSITAGKSSGVTDPTEWISYRKDLWESLNASGYYVKFAGSQINGEAYGGFDANHEGHGGVTDSDIRDNVNAFLTTNPTDVVLLHIGTNGLSPDPSQVEEILQNIDTVNEDIIVVLARIINRSGHSQITTDFNDNVEAMALDRIANGDKIILVDLEDGAGINYASQPTGDMWDNLHPFETGYSKMAAVWLDALDNFLLVCDPVIPEITSSAMTYTRVDQVYMYDVEASGFPVPTYTLTTAPAGMNVDVNSGLITWTPTMTGVYSVTVTAVNTAGMDLQSFSLMVDEPSGCLDGTVAYWPLDESSGTTFADIYTGHDATFEGSGSPGYATGKLNGGIDFNGSNQRLATASLSNTTSQLTVMSWVNPDQLAAPDRGIISKQGVFVLEIEEDGDEVAFTLINGGNFDEFEPDVAANEIPTGEWTHIAATFDGTNTTLYINGVTVASEVSSLTSLGNSTAPYYLGWMSHTTFGTNRYFDGKLDEVAVFERALSAGEVQQLYNKTLSQLRYCETIAPEITSTANTSGKVGELYQYDVEASGFPVPTYTLTTAPAGMNVDVNSGLITWTPTTAGVYSITVAAVNTIDTDIQNYILVVNPPSEQIIINIISPAQGASFVENSNVEIDVGVLQGGSSISKVSYYANAALIGEDNIAPYSFDWTNVPSGNYTLTAVATDTENNSVSSNTINIQVNKSDNKIFLPVVLRETP